MTYKPKQPRRVPISARIEESLLRWVQSQAKKEGITPSDWIRQTLQNKKEARNAND